MNIIEIEIPNWKKFNGRADCAATWLRLENRLFESDEMYRMSGAEISVWIYILCQASKKGAGRFSFDFEMAVGRIKVKRDVIDSAIQKLTESGALIVHDRPRTSTSADVRSCAGDERTNETNVTNERDAAREPGGSLPKVAEIWNEKTKTRPKVKSWTPVRARAAKGLDEARWAAACDKVEASEFLSGRSGKWVGANFDWMLNPKNLTKVIEGNYDNRAGPVQIPRVERKREPARPHSLTPISEILSQNPEIAKVRARI